MQADAEFRGQTRRGGQRMSCAIRSGVIGSFGILRPMNFSTSGSETAYSSQAKLIASPEAPARAVRPMRCT